MSDNKFIKHLRGEDTTKSVLEIKNQRTTTSFASMPDGDTSNANDVYSDHRGNATGVLKGTENWKLDGQNLVETATVYGDGRDFTDSFSVFGNGLWVDATCTFVTARRFSPNTKFVLKLCGHDLETVINHTVDFTLIVKFGTSNLISKTFTVTEQAFDFCKEFVIDFAESNSSTIKADAGSTMQIQLLCADPAAQAVLYNGMTVFTALQRRVDGDAVASDKKTFDEVVQDIDDINEEIDDLEEYIDDTFVRLDGESIMTGPLKMRATSSFQCAIAPFWDGVGFYKLNSDNSVTLIASIETPDGFVPWATNTYNIGSSLKKWKNLYLAGKLFVATLNNGGDLTVPANTTGTLATKADVDLAANSGRMITDTGVWYAKMYAATVAPSAENGTNYADFSQVDGQGNPIIVIYERQNGAWVQDQIITPPAEYDGYVPITSKIWDIAEQTNQQGGRVLWNHQSKEFTPYPNIVDLSNVATTNLDNLTTTGKANVSKQGTYDSGETYSAGTIGAALYALFTGKADLATTLAGYGITDGANIDLSNLTNTGKANVSKQGTYDSGETYSAGTVGKAIQNKANVALDNLTTSGKNKLGPDILRATGIILNSSGDTVEGIGIAEVYLYKNGVARVEFALQISQAGTSISAFVWGINRDLLKIANANIPTITPSGGVVTYYDASGFYVAGLNGYGGGASPVSQFWQLGRIYNTSGGFGGWPASQMQVNTHITGTLWGTYTA